MTLITFWCKCHLLENNNRNVITIQREIKTDILSNTALLRRKPPVLYQKSMKSSWNRQQKMFVIANHSDTSLFFTRYKIHQQHWMCRSWKNDFLLTLILLTSGIKARPPTIAILTSVTSNQNSLSNWSIMALLQPTLVNHRECWVKAAFDPYVSSMLLRWRGGAWLMGITMCPLGL